MDDQADTQIDAAEATIPPSPDHGVARRFAEFDDEALTAEVARVGAQVAAGQARLVELAAEADRRVIWANWEARSLAEWLSWLTGMAPRNSRDHALVADRLDDFPATHAALCSGVISFDQARAIASTEAPEHDHKLAELAQQTTAGQLQRVVRAYRKVRAVGATDDANAAHERRYLNYFFDDRCFELHGRLAPEDGAVVATALDRARDRLFRSSSSDQAAAVPHESRPAWDSPEQLRADALVAVAEAWLTEHKTSSRANPYEVIVHVDADALRCDAPGARCEIDGAGSIAPETARRMTCDSALVGLIEYDGEALSIGRRSQRVTHALRRALEARDQTCCFPGCANEARLDAHHIVHWVKDGYTEPPNLALLCKRHHRMVHEGGYTMERLPDGAWRFTRPTGDVVKLPTRPPARPEALFEANEAAGRRVERAPLAPEGAGEGIDLHYVTWALFFQ